MEKTVVRGNDKKGRPEYVILINQIYCPYIHQSFKYLYLISDSRTIIFFCIMKLISLGCFNEDSRCCS